LGNWDIESHTIDALKLSKIYSGVDTNGLDYVIGNENRMINGQIAVADITSPN